MRGFLAQSACRGKWPPKAVAGTELTFRGLAYAFKFTDSTCPPRFLAPFKAVWSRLDPMHADGALDPGGAEKLIDWYLSRYRGYRDRRHHRRVADG